jgi:hypothetical protein
MVIASWTAPSPATGITGYTAYAVPGPATCSTTAADPTTCILGAVAGQPYSVMVVAHSSSGVDSPPSSTSTTVTPTSPVVPIVAPLSAPTSLTTSRGQVASVVPSEALTVTGTGFLPDSTADVIIYSTATPLATVTTDSRGDFSAAVTVPADLQFGQHNFVASGEDSSGHTHLLRLPITISAASDPRVANHVIAVADNHTGDLLATAIGNVYNHGTKFWGSPHLRHVHLVTPIVGIAATSRGGYLEATAGGNVFNYRAKFDGSPHTRHVKLTSPIVGIAATGGGYVLTTAAGNVYAYGTRSHGSPRAAHVALTSPIVGIATTANGGYVLATASGQVYAYDVRFGGSPQAHITAASPVSGITAANGTYKLTTITGKTYTYRT